MSEANAEVSIKTIDGRVVMAINPSNDELGIQLSRFYLLNEAGAEVEFSAMGPCGVKEEDEPILLWIDLEAKTEEQKKLIEEYF